MGQKLQRPGALRLQGADTERMRWLRGRQSADFYPPEARRKGLDGSAIVDLLINDEGKVQEAVVVSESPRDAGFGLAALDTAKTYEFENPLQQPVLLLVTILFEP